MQVSKQKVNPILEKQLSKTFYQLVADLDKSADVELVFKDLLSSTELTTITKRLAVAYWLSKNRSYQNVKNNLKVSSASVAAIKKCLKRPGWCLAIAKITADEWANVWEEKIKGVFKKS